MASAHSALSAEAEENARMDASVEGNSFETIEWREKHPRPPVNIHRRDSAISEPMSELPGAFIEQDGMGALTGFAIDIGSAPLFEACLYSQDAKNAEKRMARAKVAAQSAQVVLYERFEAFLTEVISGLEGLSSTKKACEIFYSQHFTEARRRWEKAVLEKFSGTLEAEKDGAKMLDKSVSDEAMQEFIELGKHAAKVVVPRLLKSHEELAPFLSRKSFIEKTAQDEWKADLLAKLHGLREKIGQAFDQTVQFYTVLGEVASESSRDYAADLVERVLGQLSEANLTSLRPMVRQYVRSSGRRLNDRDMVEAIIKSEVVIDDRSRESSLLSCVLEKLFVATREYLDQARQKRNIKPFSERSINSSPMAPYISMCILFRDRCGDSDWVKLFESPEQDGSTPAVKYMGFLTEQLAVTAQHYLTNASRRPLWWLHERSYLETRMRFVSDVLAIAGQRSESCKDVVDPGVSNEVKILKSHSGAGVSDGSGSCAFPSAFPANPAARRQVEKLCETAELPQGHNSTLLATVRFLSVDFPRLVLGDASLVTEIDSLLRAEASLDVEVWRERYKALKIEQEKERLQFRQQICALEEANESMERANHEKDEKICALKGFVEQIKVESEQRMQAFESRVTQRIDQLEVDKNSKKAGVQSSGHAVPASITGSSRTPAPFNVSGVLLTMQTIVTDVTCVADEYEEIDLGA